EGERLALDQADIKRVRQAALDRGVAHPGERFEPSLRLDRIERENGRAAADRECVQNRLAAGARAPFDLHVLDGEAAARGEGVEALRGGMLRCRDGAAALEP